ncbi:hypothetical protein AB4511_05295 [Vibrio sp. 10N.222.54.F6]|uniref:hypothetical protein n=1 Tax=unclassified Vibrio TaxID=2614977 RepID=UPI000C82B43F|nr:hypothetical protein [Vibrio sp. 10N.261.51.A7]PML73468.1 hypothetical protein BCT71_07840 [Vibrio sp. 10N.261.51.A7]
MKKILTVALLLMSSVTHAKAPFGLEWGASKADLVGEVGRDDTYTVFHDLYVPVPQSLYINYTGYANESGLYAVAARTYIIRDDYSGEKGRDSFYNTIRALEKSNYKKTHSLIKSSKSNPDFYKCLRENACNAYTWTGEDKDGDKVSARIESLGSKSGYILVQYIKKGLSIYGF